VARIVIGRLLAFDAAERTSIALDPGTLIEECHIHRNPGTGEDRDLEVYVMRFESEGRALRCPLVEFQARTEAVPSVVEETPAREIAAVS
jgi:hypothetical protein